MIAGEEPCEPVERVRLGGSEVPDRSVEVGRRGSDRNDGARATGRHERRVPPARRVRLQQRARDPHGHVEARLGRLADGAPRIAVEEHDDAVARGVLELLDHELTAPRARRPVHAT